MNIQEAANQGAQNLQKLLADKSSRDQREKQQGVVNIDLLKNCVFSSVLPLELDVLSALSGSTDKIYGSFLQHLSFYGATSLYSKRKPVSFFLSLYGAVIDLDWVIEKLQHAQNDPDKYGSDNRAYQEAIQNSKPPGHEAQEKYEHTQHEQRQNEHKANSGGGGGGENSHKQDEMEKFSEGYRRHANQKHQDENLHNHYHASQIWKRNADIMEEIKRKHESHNYALQKLLRDSNELFQKDQRIQNAKRRR